MALLTLAIERAVSVSARARPQRDGGITGVEVRRRSQWCVETSLSLLKHAGWSSERVSDNLTTALLTWIDEGAWEPPAAGAPRMWAPGDGGNNA
jgi:hypothetical protein